MPHTAFPSLPATVPVFWNVSTHFFYPCAHSVIASSMRCHLNRRKLNTYRETRPPSWENGTWQVPSQLSHSVIWGLCRTSTVACKISCWSAGAFRTFYTNVYMPLTTPLPAWCECRVWLGRCSACGHQRCERLPASSEVPGGSLDVRQRRDCGLHQERGRHEIAQFDADDHTTAQVVRPQGDYIGSCPSARSAQHPGGFPVQSRPDTDHGVDDGHGASTTHVCQVGWGAGRLVCDIRQQTTHQVCIAVSGP